MKIAHLCLSCFFIDGHSYQENEIVRQHVLDGHEVIVLASTETYTSDGLVTYTNSGEYVGSEGAKIKRLAYRGFLPNFVMAKLRINVGVYDSLTAFQPDVILFHGTCGWELLTAARYVSKNRRVLLYVDSHEDRNNSARGFISREILHRRYYGAIIRRALPHIRKILCISTESIDFVHDLYKIPMSHLEFFPLGGRPIPDVEYRNRRDTTRNRYGLTDRNKLLIQSESRLGLKSLLKVCVR